MESVEALARGRTNKVEACNVGKAAEILVLEPTQNHTKREIQLHVMEGKLHRYVVPFLHGADVFIGAAFIISVRSDDEHGRFRCSVADRLQPACTWYGVVSITCSTSSASRGAHEVLPELNVRLNGRE
jgi:hypothetical protein